MRLVLERISLFLLVSNAVETWSWKLTNLDRGQERRQVREFHRKREQAGRDIAPLTPRISSLPSIYPPKRSEASGVDSRCPSLPRSIARSACYSRGESKTRACGVRPSVQGVAGVNGSLCSSIVDPLGIQSKERHPVM